MRRLLGHVGTLQAHQAIPHDLDERPDLGVAERLRRSRLGEFLLRPQPLVLDLLDPPCDDDGSAPASSAARYLASGATQLTSDRRAASTRAATPSSGPCAAVSASTASSRFSGPQWRRSHPSSTGVTSASRRYTHLGCLLAAPAYSAGNP